MAEPIKWRSKIILAKPEPLASYGVDSVPTGPLNAMLMTNITFQPMEGQSVSRNLERPYMGAQEELPVGLYSVLQGDIELVGSGSTGVAPAWSPIIRACGVAEVVTPDGGTANSGKVEYSPVSDNQESVSIYFLIGTTRYVMLGTRGTGVVTVNAMGIPVFRVTLTGLFTVPSVQARPTVNLTKFSKPQAASKASTPVFTIGGVDFAMREFQLNLGCDVQTRMLVGQERIVIVDKAEQISCTVEAVVASTYNPVAQAGTPTADAPKQVINLEHGTIIGRRVKVNAATAVQQRFAGPQENQGVEEWPLSFSPLPTAGDDQWKITLT